MPMLLLITVNEQVWRGVRTACKSQSKDHVATYNVFDNLHQLFLSRT